MKKNELPKNLFKRGFLRPTDKRFNEPQQIIDIYSLEDIRTYIESNFTKIKTQNKRRTSYSYKHFVEEQIGRYVCNGDFIASMILCGFKYEEDYHCLNAYFNLSEKSYKEAKKNAKVNPHKWN